MPKNAPTGHFVQEKSTVTDADRTATFPARSTDRLAPAPFDPQRQSLLLLGLPGSGCGALATALADRLDLMLALLGIEQPYESLPQALARAMQAMAAPGQVVVLDDRLAVALDGQALSFLPVVPVYLIADVGLCLAGLGQSTDEAIRQELVARQNALEPAAMVLARHIIRADLPTEKQLAQVLDKLLIESDEEELDLPS